MKILTGHHPYMQSAQGWQDLPPTNPKMVQVALDVNPFKVFELAPANFHKTIRQSQAA